MHIQAKASEEPSKTLAILTPLVVFCPWNDGSHFFYRSNLFIWVLQKQKASIAPFWLHMSCVLPVLLIPVPVLALVLLSVWGLGLCLCSQLAVYPTCYGWDSSRINICWLPCPALQPCLPWRTPQPMSIINCNVFVPLVEYSGQTIAGPICLRVAQVQTAYVCKFFYNPL